MRATHPSGPHGQLKDENGCQRDSARGIRMNKLLRDSLTTLSNSIRYSNCVVLLLLFGGGASAPMHAQPLFISLPIW